MGTLIRRGADPQAIVVIDPRAEAIQAVNTVLIREGKFIGYNTDCSGFTTGFGHGLPGVTVGSVVQFGSGGAGSAVAEALLLAARVRLRPILMTTLAMIFGMVPLAFALSEGSEQRAPMGQAVIGGVITSSLLTLVVVPVVYCYMDDLARWALGKMGRGHSTSGPSKIRGLS